MVHRYNHDSCTICHETFNATVPDICRVLGCMHVFHAKCIDLWFIKATFCPLCKSDLKLTYMSTASHPTLRRSSQNSSHRSLGSGSQSLSSLRSGQILVGHSNSDPALLRVLQENPHATGAQGSLHRGSPLRTPEDRHYRSTPSLAISFSDRSLPIMGSSRSSRSIGSSSSGAALPVVQEASEEARAADDSQRSQSSNPSSPLTMNQESQVVGSGQDEQVTSPAWMLNNTTGADTLQGALAAAQVHDSPGGSRTQRGLNPAPLSRAPQGGLIKSPSMQMPQPLVRPLLSAKGGLAEGREVVAAEGTICRVSVQPSNIAATALAPQPQTTQSASSQSPTALPLMSNVHIPGLIAPPLHSIIASHSGSDYSHVYRGCNRVCWPFATAPAPTLRACNVDQAIVSGQHAPPR